MGLRTAILTVIFLADLGWVLYTGTVDDNKGIYIIGGAFPWLSFLGILLVFATTWSAMRDRAGRGERHMRTYASEMSAMTEALAGQQDTEPGHAAPPAPYGASVAPAPTAPSRPAELLERYHVRALSPGTPGGADAGAVSGYGEVPGEAEPLLLEIYRDDIVLRSQQAGEASSTPPPMSMIPISTLTAVGGPEAETTAAYGGATTYRLTISTADGATTSLLFDDMAGASDAAQLMSSLAAAARERPGPSPGATGA